MYFSCNNKETANFLANVIRMAQHKDQRVRIDVDSEGNLRIKRGEGMWSSPMPSDPDPYRDLSQRLRTVPLQANDEYVLIDKDSGTIFGSNVVAVLPPGDEDQWTDIVNSDSMARDYAKANGLRLFVQTS